VLPAAARIGSSQAAFVITLRRASEQTEAVFQVLVSPLTFLRQRLRPEDAAHDFGRCGLGQGNRLKRDLIGRGYRRDFRRRHSAVRSSAIAPHPPLETVLQGHEGGRWLDRVGAGPQPGGFGTAGWLSQGRFDLHRTHPVARQR